MALGLALIMIAFGAEIQSASWPDRPVRIVAAAPPGSPSDVISRIVGAKLGEDLGQPFITDNRGGAGGTIAPGIISRASPDGYTVGVVSGSYSATPALQKLPYDPVRGVAPVGMLADGPMLLVVHPSLKANNLKELIDLARAKPNSLAAGSTGVGSIAHLAIEFMQQSTKTRMVHVPFAGAFLAVNALLGGEVQMVFVSPGPAIPHVKTGKARALAVTSAQRWPVIPDLPAMAEQLPGFSASVWFGMLAPPATSSAVIASVNRAVGSALNQPDVQERLRVIGLEATHSTPEAFGRIILRDMETWAKVVKAGNIKL